MQTAQVRLIHVSHTGPGQRTQGSAFNGCFAQGLASCWLPGVRSAHEFLILGEPDWLREGLCVVWKRGCCSSALSQPRSALAGQVQANPLTVVCNLCLSERITHPTKALYLSSSDHCCQILTCRYVQSAAAGESEPTFAFSTQVSTAQCFCKGSGSWHMQCVNVRLQSSLMLFGRRHCLSLPAAARQRAPCRGPPVLLSCRGTSGTMEMMRPEQGRTSTRG